MALLPTTADQTGVEWTVRVHTSRIERTNVTLVTSRAETLVIDAPYFPDELDDLASKAPAGRVRLFATHSHYDHLLARYAFPDAPLLVGTPTAQALAKDPDRPYAELTNDDARHYVTRPRPLLFGVMEGVAVPGEIEVGAIYAELIEAAGHTGDGAALWFPDAGLLCCGDYLSDVEIPWVDRDGDVEAYRATLARLRPYVEQARLVVPGHGTPTGGLTARRRLEEDLAYLETVPAGDKGQTLPSGRDTPRQREIHALNLQRHGPKKAAPKQRKKPAA